MRHLSLLLLPLAISACTGRDRAPASPVVDGRVQQPEAEAQAGEPDSELVQELTKLGYAELFQSGRHNQVDRIYSGADAPAKLRAIVRSRSTSGVARFLSAEILFERDQEFPGPGDPALLAHIYSKALLGSGEPNSYHLSGNLWGFLYRRDDAGHLGGRVVKLGRVAVEPLRPLLDSSKHVLYEGSREATEGNEYNYRVKDFAAYYLSRITGVPITFQQDLPARDAEIHAFAQRLDRWIAEHPTVHGT